MYIRDPGFTGISQGTWLFCHNWLWYSIWFFTQGLVLNFYFDSKTGYLQIWDATGTPGNLTLVYDRNHLFGLGSDTETETENWPKLSADTETNRNQKILNLKALYQGVCKNSLYRHSL